MMLDYFEFESGQQQVRHFAGLVLRMGWFYCGSIPHVGWKPTPWLGAGRNP